jgi:hypothetical protein
VPTIVKDASFNISWTCLDEQEAANSKKVRLGVVNDWLKGNWKLTGVLAMGHRAFAGFHKR